MNFHYTLVNRIHYIYILTLHRIPLTSNPKPEKLQQISPYVNDTCWGLGKISQLLYLWFVEYYTDCPQLIGQSE